MKTIKLKMIVVLFALLSFSAFAQNNETRQLEGFNRVHSSGFFDVELTKGDKEEAKIVANNFDLSKLIMEVEGGTLKIYKEKYYRTRWNAKVKIYLTYKQIDGLKNSGSGDLLCKSDVEGGEAWFKSSGSGNIKVEGTIKADDVKAQNSGSGNIYFEKVIAKSLFMEKSGSGNFGVGSGSVGKEQLTSSGSGNIKTEGLVSNVCYVKISGSGNAGVNASDELKAQVSGSGNIRYRGNPQLNSKVSGSGSIRSF